MLIGTITQEGLLQINRGGELKDQYCPFSVDRLECGDWCPLFGEPSQISGSQTDIQMCNDQTLHFIRLVDQREEEDPKTEGQVLCGEAV